jgi:hypothetical protein
MADVLVEVYDHPEVMLRQPGRDVGGQTRIAACTTDKAGLYMFDLPSGYYELRFSKSEEWDVSSVPLRVQRVALHPKKKIVVSLRPGQ